MRRAWLLCAVAIAVTALSPAAQAYLKQGVTANGQVVALRWSRLPIRYFVSDADVPGVTASQFREAVGRAFQTWHAVPSAAVDFSFVGFTGAEPGDQDNASTLGFVNRPDLERTLAVTNYLVDTRTGELLESDILFNSSYSWSVADAGERGRYDVQSLATHEIGHFIGLGHSAIGETTLDGGGQRRLIAARTVMFPIAFAAGDISMRLLRADDIAGVSDLYPASAFRADTGTIQGTVTKGGTGVLGAHVTAFSLATGTLVGGFSLDSSGAFAIAGLTPGSYIVRVEPLDDGDTTSYFNSSVDVDTDFRVAYYPHILTITAGRSTPPVSIAVTPK
jgi:predicted Zn-dependent protease